MNRYRLFAAGLAAVVVTGLSVSLALADGGSVQQGYVITKATILENEVTLWDANGDQVASLSGAGVNVGLQPQTATWPEIWHALQQSNFTGDAYGMSNNDSTDPPVTGIDPALLATWQAQAIHAMQNWTGWNPPALRDDNGQMVTFTPPDQTSILEFENLIHDADVVDKSTNGWTGAIQPLQPNAPNPVTPPGGSTAPPNPSIGQSVPPVQPPVTSLPSLQTVSPQQQEHQILEGSVPKPGQTTLPTPAKVTPPATTAPVKVTTPVNREADKGYYEATHMSPAALRHWKEWAQHKAKPAKNAGREIGWLLVLLGVVLVAGFSIERTIRYRRNKTQHGW